MRSIAVILDSQGNKSFSSPDDGRMAKTPSTETDGDIQTPRRHPPLPESNSGSKLLRQLLLDTSDRVVHHQEEVCLVVHCACGYVVDPIREHPVTLT